METINSSALKKRLASDSNINFLAFLVTPWHAHGVNAFMRFKQDQGVRLRGIICIGKNAQAGYLIDDSYLIHSNEITIVRYDSRENKTIKSSLKNLLDTWRGCYFLPPVSDKCDIYVLNCVNPYFGMHAFLKLYLKKQPLAVLIDEGLATYMRSNFGRLCESLSFKNSILKKSIIVYSSLISSAFLRKMVSYNEIYHFQIFDYGNHELERNDFAIKYYKDVLSLTKNIDAGYVKDYENAVVINTQAYFEMGQIINDLDIEIIKLICRECGNLGLNVLLKPHPRENHLERYDGIDNLVVDSRKGVSQESIIAGLEVKPTLVIGITSTTLVSLKVLFDVNTVSVAPYFLNQRIGPRLRGDCKDFCRTFEKFVPCLATTDELLREINRTYNN